MGDATNPNSLDELVEGLERERDFYRQEYESLAADRNRLWPVVVAAASQVGARRELRSIPGAATGPDLVAAYNAWVERCDQLEQAVDAYGHPTQQEAGDA